MNDTKTKALDAALAQIERQFGKGTIQKLGDEARKAVDVIPTGCNSLDEALGIGGYPRGRVIEIYGPESSGKTTLALHAIAEAQKLGGTAAFVDAEHALDPNYAHNLGVDIDNMLISQPDCGEQALEVVDMLTRSGSVDIIVVDSVAALTPKSELEGDMGDSHMGLHARLMSQALRKLTGSISNTKTTIIFINQIRMKIGVMFGNPETTTGGNALKFYASVRLDVRRTGAIKKGDEVLGNETRAKVVKNKMAPPFKQANFKIIYGEGVSRPYELKEIGKKNGTVIKSGAWYSVDNVRYQGENNLIEALRNDPSVEAFIMGEEAIASNSSKSESNSLGLNPDERLDTDTGEIIDVKDNPSTMTTESKPAKVVAPTADAPENHPVIKAGIENGAIVRNGPAWVKALGESFRGNVKVLERVLEDANFASRILEFKE